ncbi:MAG: phage portal protein [Bacteroidales bacterium]|nr:phage portal protein [Bacteroidales bacterium]
MKECAKAYLEKLGYAVNNNALGIIEMCDNWYANRIIDDFHKRKNLNGVEYELSRMNFAKRCCADDANLCEIISVAPEKESTSKEFVKQILDSNQFDVQYREQLEKISATGTTGAYIYLQNANYMRDVKGNVSVKGGKICINYVDADCIIPLTVENKLITECAFCATNITKGKEKTTLVIFTKDMVNEKALYKADTVMFDEQGNKIDAESNSIQLGETKPFAIMRNAEVNNLDNMKGYGLPKVYNSIPLFKAVDLCYNLLYGDLSKGDKLVFLNELLACIGKDKNGNPVLTPQQKEIFILLGEAGGKLPDEKSLVQEYNPEIRIEQITKAFELVLSLLSMSFGYGTKKYTFENGRITTATEYMGTKQDCVQELNKQRKQSTDYIEDIIHAAMWFSNQFCNTSYNTEEPLSIEFDDSYIIDKESELERKRNDALSFDIPQLTIWYLMDAYNIPEEEATAMVMQKREEEERNTDGDDED